MFSCGTQRVVPSKQDSTILPAQIVSHSAGFGSSSADKASRLIKTDSIRLLGQHKKLAVFLAWSVYVAETFNKALTWWASKFLSALDLYFSH